METQLATRRRYQRHSYADPTTMEMHYTDQELEFMLAMDRYKRDNNRPHPSWHEVLEVIYGLGYRKVFPAKED